MRGLLALALLALGCSGSDSGSGGSGGSDGGVGVVPGTVQLAVSVAEEQSSIGGVEAPPSQMFVSVRFGMSNGLNDAIALSPAAFRISTAEGLEKLASPHSVLLEGACPADAFLSAGQILDCAVSFELEQSEVPTALVYLGAGLSRVEAPIQELVHCPRCAGQCVDLTTDPAHCGACGVSIPTGGSCELGAPSCPAGLSDCGGKCVDLMTSLSHCGACFQSTGSALCKDGAPSCPEGHVFGNGKCVDLTSDDSNCGQVGHVCSSGTSCLGGQCLTFESSPDRISCSAVCATVGKQCKPYDGNPFFMYDCGDSLLGFENAPCNAVPKQSTPWGVLTCTFDSVECYCG
jgi:hypothetical protein